MQRYQALLERKHAGTMLISPFDLMATGERLSGAGQITRCPGKLPGCRGRSAPGLGPGQRAAGHRVHPRHGLRRGVAVPAGEQGRGPAHLRSEMPQGTTTQAAATAYAALLNPAEGFQ